MELRKLTLYLAAASAFSSFATGVSAQPDVSQTIAFDEEHGFPGVCTAPCFRVEKQADFYLAGNPSAPAVCGPGENTFVFTLTHLGGTLPSPGIPVTEAEVGLDASLVASVGSIAGAGVAPTSSSVNPLGAVGWTFPLASACPSCLQEGQVSDPLFLCAAAPAGTVVASVTAITVDAGADSLGPVEPTDVLCPDIAVGGCIAAGKARLFVDEKKPGFEKLKLKLAEFEVATTQSDLGDPVNLDTRYDVCIYDDLDQLVGELIVDRAGELCGSKPCWKDKRGKGWSYKDLEASSDGVKRLTALSGKVGRGSIEVRAQNDVKKGQTSLPTGIAAALENVPSPRVQVRTSDAACFDAILDKIQRANGVRAKARMP